MRFQIIFNAMISDLFDRNIRTIINDVKKAHLLFFVLKA